MPTSDTSTITSSSAVEGGGLGITALVVGLCGVVLAIFWPLGLIVGCIAIVFGFIARKSRRRAVAIGGIAMGALTIVLSIVVAILSLTGVLGDDEECFETDRGTTYCVEES